MPRPRRYRRVSFRPDITYFKPAGVRLSVLDECILTIEELEAINWDFKRYRQKGIDNIRKPYAAEEIVKIVLEDIERPEGSL